MTVNQIMTISALRERMKLTQQELADLLGVQVVVLRRWEYDSTDIPKRIINEISKILVYPEDAIFLGKPSNLITKLKSSDN